MRSLHIDIETYCEIDLKKAGAYRYAEEAEVILFAYAYDDEPVVVIDLLSGEQIPDAVMDDLTDPFVIKKAFNAAFERAVMQAYFNMKLPVNQWQCTQALTAMCGLPLNLGQAAMVLNIDQQKDKGGTALIKYFCVPIAKPIKKNNFRARNLPEHDLVKWQQFKIYNGKDVDAERAVCRKLSFYQISEFEHKQWQLDQLINERGVAINVPFVRTAISLINHYENSLLQEFTDITGIDKPTKLGQLKKWLFDETGEEVEKINKETIPDIIKNTDSQKVLRAMEIRKESSKTSTKKYPTMMAALCRDGRVRGLHEYYGANRTGRAAGRLLQHQNLPRGNYKNIEPVRDLVMLNDPDLLEYVYGAIPDCLSSLIRSAIVPAEGHRFIISDYSAIEAVVAAWLANEEWMLEVFRTHGKLYEMSAAKMFNIPIEQITKDSPYRQKGKVSELSGTYGGSVGAFIKMGALREGILETELPALVKGYRLTHLNIVALWSAIDMAAKLAIQTGTRTYLHEMFVDTLYVKGDRVQVNYYPPNRGISFYMRGKSMFIQLPSGRELVYCNAGMEEGEYGLKIVYWGIDQTKKKWSKQDTYGPKLLENIDQATSRDITMNGLQNLHRAGYGVILHVHDEAVCETPIGVGSLDEVNRLMVNLPEWAKDMPLKAAGEESFYYKK